MGIFGSIKSQLRSVIEWENANPNELFHLWTENGDEIKNCSKLIVKPGQGVIFLYEGKVQAVHMTEGLYELNTANIPFITTLTKFMQGFVSQHKVGIYFFWRTEFLNQKWGTPTPVKYNDPVYKFPVALRSFGNFSFKITKPDAFFANVVGSRASFLIDDARKVIAARFLQPMTDLFATSGYSYAQVDAHREELAVELAAKLKPEFEKLGFEMTDFRLESTDFDEETQKRIGRIADVMADSQAAASAGMNYMQLQQAQALRDAARNEGGAAGAGIGVGAGLGMGQLMAQGMMGMGQQAPAAAAAATPDLGGRMKQLKDLLDQKLISQEEYDKKRAEILSAI